MQIPSWARRMVGFDTETTGTDENARVIEFGICVWEDGIKVISLSWLINPGPDLDLAHPSVAPALAVNHITAEQLRDQPTFDEVFSQIAHGLQQADVRVAHNSPFDQRMLRQDFARCVKAGTLTPDAAKKTGPSFTLDTLALDLHVKGERGHSLQAVAQRWGVQGWEEHRAAGDAEAAVRIAYAMSPHLPPEINTVMLLQKKAQDRWQGIMDKRRAQDAARQG